MRISGPQIGIDFVFTVDYYYVPTFTIFSWTVDVFRKKLLISDWILLRVYLTKYSSFDAACKVNLSVTS